MLTPLPLPNFNPCIVSSSIPTNIFMKFEAHDNETHAVKWSPVERLVATGGGDRKVKLWDVGKGALEPRAVLGGSSAGINSVDFDSTGSYILGTSNDYGARVWTVSDNRLRVSENGESVENVVNAKDKQSVNQNKNNYENINGKHQNAAARGGNCAINSQMLNVDSQYFG
uniref:Autophagy-related protein 16 n=2 Tax=Ceratitis capitata TaxID=7213 RepID=W8AQX1_CERCA